jgi:hypothetical protein
MFISTVAMKMYIDIPIYIIQTYVIQSQGGKTL